MHFKYFASIFLGEPGNKKNTLTIKRNMQFWGIVHYLARSGLHVVIFIAIWQTLLKFLPVSFLFKEIILILLLGLYSVMSWASIPFYRAFYTFLAIRTSSITYTRLYYIPTLACISLFFLIYNPLLLFSLDFQLSFGITFALAMLNEIKSKHSKQM